MNSRYGTYLCAVGGTVLMLMALAPASRAQEPPLTSGVSTPRAADGRTDLTGVWVADDPARRTAPQTGDTGSLQVYLNVPGLNPDSPNVFKEMDALAVAQRAASSNKPVYKPELQAKVKELSDLQAKLDPAFYCRPPGVPRMGPPNEIVQTRGQVVFLYANQNAFRAIPTDGRPHRTDVEPSYMGDSVGRWEGDTLVVEANQFTEDTWLGSDGYFHSSAMRVIERFERTGNTLKYSARVEDPEALAEPWTMNPRTLWLSTDPADAPVESPPCVERSSPHMTTNEHH